MKKILYRLGGIAAVAMSMSMSSCGEKQPADVIYHSKEFTVYNNRVEQGEFTATAVSPTGIVTNYKSPLTSGTNSLVNFRFSINSRDNELAQGRVHTAIIGSAEYGDSMIHKFGEEGGVPAGAVGEELPKDSKWTIRVDMRPMLDSFKENGWFVTATGDSIYADDFKGLWIAGSVEPLSWDFENLYGKHDRKLIDRGDGIFEVTLTVNPTTDRLADVTEWKTDSVDTRFPQYSSDQMLVDALYNMAIDNVKGVLRPDSTYRAGSGWDGVWTRDVSYSIYLSLACLDPENSMRSLRCKVKNGRIIQDTGTGGAWPVSSDREVWAIAAWEIYKVTGDKEWLAEAYDIITASLKDDMLVVWNNKERLMHGEQSYLDWREQTYPKWMQPKDIYESMCLGTNVVFARAFEIVDEMAEELGREPIAEFDGMDETLRNSINRNLWIESKGYYGQYLYGGVYPILSQSTDALGQSLSVLFDIATDEMAQSIVSKSPIVPFGTSSVFPQLPDIKPYHNDAVWPFVQAYWNLAAADVENITAFNAGFGALCRAAALFGTHKELFVASNGDYRGTAVNSDMQLWSSTGYAAMLLRVFAGMEFETDGIEFDPFVPHYISGTKQIKGLRYRNATLDITIMGTGDEIAQFSIDGKVSGDYEFPASMSGHHTIEIVMADNEIAPKPVNMVEQAWMPSTPYILGGGDTVSVGYAGETASGVNFNVYVNGIYERTDELKAEIDLLQISGFAMIDVVPEENNLLGFTMQPIEHIPDYALTVVQAENAGRPGTTLIKDPKKARRFVEITKTKHTTLKFKAFVPEEGAYFVDFRYANGSGPINTENKCAIRTLMVNGERAGAIVMPQRGIGEWLSTGFSNRVAVNLREGENILSLEYLVPENINMNGDVNTALVDYIRIIRK